MFFNKKNIYSHLQKGDRQAKTAELKQLFRSVVSTKKYFFCKIHRLAFYITFIKKKYYRIKSMTISLLALKNYKQ